MKFETNFSVYPQGELYLVGNRCYIISGTPFLLIKPENVMVLGDIHLGHESELHNKDSTEISISCKLLTQDIVTSIKEFGIERVIVNGDIKHHTQSIKIQELEELKYFATHIIDNNVKIQFVRGNHDRLIEFILSHVDLEFIEICDRIVLDEILIHHGHLDFENSKAKLVISSHEHPAFTFRGHNNARIKLPAFVNLDTDFGKAIILPSANYISSGIDFPVQSNDKFLSPYLQRSAIIESMEIHPFDRKMGIFELPPVKYWD